ncbi:hypothetical protein J1605_015149 [Eschrichtius robustus]|uniref:Protein IMPACT n=2 Tax=Eschrichtius robustus TaxID=9764 RepID=A0AB34GCK7_ESCRO|nr:hypothetical protein J1605_015149 [Eschrichtius robustus]
MRAALRGWLAVPGRAALRAALQPAGGAAARARLTVAAPRPRAPDLGRWWPLGRSRGHMAEGDGGSDQRQRGLCPGPPPVSPAPPAPEAAPFAPPRPFAPALDLSRSLSGRPLPGVGALGLPRALSPSTISTRLSSSRPEAETRVLLPALSPPGHLGQNEEIEAMAAIYGEEWCVIDDCAKIFCIRISDDIDDPKWTLCLQVMLPNEYPGTAPPIYQLNAPWLQGQERADLSNSLEEIYIENIGESILYLWVEKIRDVLIQKSQMTEPGPDVKKKTEEEDIECEDDLILACQPENPVKALDFDVSENRTEIEELPPIDHGIPITDRRSTFQAHLAPVVCPKQVKMVLAKLYENKKIASATHNIYAYRIYCEDKQTFLQDCEDDGETAAGGRLLHLMEILNVRNVMVVVSRWYGGILLGPDRFKHINNCARNILVEKNYTSSPEESSKTLGKNKKVRKDKKRSEH